MIRSNFIMGLSEQSSYKLRHKTGLNWSCVRSKRLFLYAQQLRYLIVYSMQQVSSRELIWCVRDLRSYDAAMHVCVKNSLSWLCTTIQVLFSWNVIETWCQLEQIWRGLSIITPVFLYLTDCFIVLSIWINKLNSLRINIKILRKYRWLSVVCSTRSVIALLVYTRCKFHYQWSPAQ